MAKQTRHESDFCNYRKLSNLFWHVPGRTITHIIMLNRLQEQSRVVLEMVEEYTTKIYFHHLYASTSNTCIKYMGNSLVSPSAIVSALKHYFCSVFTNEDLNNLSSLQNSTNKFESAHSIVDISFTEVDV